jgi:hypothetical protein
MAANGLPHFRCAAECHAVAESVLCIGMGCAVPNHPAEGHGYWFA